MRNLLLSFVLLATAYGQTNLGWSPTAVETHGCQSGTEGGTCYYIDITGGSDSNNGTSKATAWAHMPGMTNATGNAASHSFAQTDEFILKGGETWPYASISSGWSIASGGATTPNAAGYPGMYVGYDPTWQTGIVNSVQVVDPGNCATNTTLSVQFSGGGGSSAAASAKMEQVDTISNPTLLSFVTMTNQGSGYTSNPTVGFTVTAGSCTRMPVAYADIYSPVISAAGTTMGTATSIPTMFTFNVGYGTVDHLEFAHDHIYSNSDYVFASAPNVILSLAKSVTFENIFLHDFALASVSGFNTFCVVGGTCQQIDVAQSAGIYLGSENGASSVINNSIFNNYEAEAQGCAAGNSYTPPYASTGCAEFTAIFTTAYSGTASGPALTNNIINNWRGGLYTTGSVSNSLVAGNQMWAGLHDVGTQHGDTYYLQSGGLTYNNILKDIYPGTAAFYVETGDGTTPTAVGFLNDLFNNVVWDIGTSTPPIGFTSEFWSTAGCNGSHPPTGCTTTGASPAPYLKAWNNTFYSYQGTSNCINTGQWFGVSPVLSQSLPFNIQMYNTHCISTQGTAHWYQDNDLTNCGLTNGCGTWNGNTSPNSSGTQTLVDPTAVIMTPTNATSEGYTTANNYAPTISSNDTVTFASGGNSQNLTSLCSGNLNGLSLASLCYDILGNVRPTSGGWQAGAYQFASGGNTVEQLSGVTMRGVVVQ